MIDVLIFGVVALAALVAFACHSGDVAIALTGAALGLALRVIVARGVGVAKDKAGL